jgi:hypothetical protein
MAGDLIVLYKGHNPLSESQVRRVFLLMNYKSADSWYLCAGPAVASKAWKGNQGFLSARLQPG